MHKNSIWFLLLCIVTFLLMSQLSFAQSPISLTGSVGGGVLLPQSSNLKGDITSSYDYPLSKTGYDIEGKIRLRLPALPFAIVGIASYNSLSDNGIISLVNIGIAPEYAKLNTSLSIFSLGVGVEDAFLPTPIIKPYIGANAVMNFFNGNESLGSEEAKLNSTSRFGLDFAVGTLIEIPILPFSLDVEAKYRLANLLGKEFNNVWPTVARYGDGFGGISPTSTYNLNDAKNPNDPKDHDRSIDYFTITLGLTFKIL